MLVLSARTATALDTATANLAQHLETHPELNLADVAWTLQTGRKPFLIAARWSATTRRMPSASCAAPTRSSDTVRRRNRGSRRFLFPARERSRSTLGALV